MVRDVMKLGVTPNKSRTMTLPEIPEEYFWDFVRGYFDGDGSAYAESPGKLRVVFTSWSEQFLKQLEARFNSLGIVTSLKRKGYSVKNKGTGEIETRYSWYLWINTRDSRYSLYIEMYTTPSSGWLRLERKFEIYKAYIDFHFAS